MVQEQKEIWDAQNGRFIHGDAGKIDWSQTVSQVKNFGPYSKSHGKPILNSFS